MDLEYQRKARKILKDCGAFVEGGHFVYSSGNHGDFYINKDALYMHPRKLDDICVMMTELATNTFGNTFDVVLAPAVAGVVVGQNIAYNLSLLNNKDVLFAYAEKNTYNRDYRVIRRGYEDAIKGKKVLLVDDIASTGNTLATMATSVMNLQGQIAGAVVICDRGLIRTLKVCYPSANKNTSVFEIQIASLVELDLQTFDKSCCPLCKSNRPIDTQIGEGNISVQQKINTESDSLD